MHRLLDLTPPIPRKAGLYEWATAAVLRTDTSDTALRAAINYPGRSMAIEVVSEKTTLLAGQWHWEVLRDGVCCEPVGAWEATCWVSDCDCDYLELAINLAGGVELQRHIVLARKDRFLLLADAVLGNVSGRLDYRSSLPLAGRVSFKGAKEGREGCLMAPGRVARVLPLSLGEWRSDGRAGELTEQSGRLQLHQTAQGCRLFAPLLVDLDRPRLRRRVTWRQLTVGKSLAVQPADVAVGYRVGIGDRQWLIYRSLAPTANRTVLGHNLSTETLVARFVKGEVESIIEIE
jgi:hypothetical protein